MKMPCSIPLPYVNAALFTLQLLLNANQDAFSPSTAPNATPDIPIAPAGYAFLIWLVIYTFTAAHVFLDCFYPQFSIYSSAHAPAYLRLCFAASCGFNMAWIALNNWLQWINVGTLDLLLLTLSLLPIYAFLSRESFTGRTPPSCWLRYWGSALAMRLYFSWICAATLLCFTASLQDLSGKYLSFEAYAFLLALLLVVGISGVVYADDPVIGLVVTWALVGIINRESTTVDVTIKHTVELLQACATLAAPVLPAMILINYAHKHTQGRRQLMKPSADVEMAKPIGSYQPGPSYGSAE